MKSRIKEIRKAANLTQEEFASKLNLTRNFIAQVETGAKDPSDRTVKDICREFGVNETWLRTGAGSMTMEKTRAAELAELVQSLMADQSESFRSALVTTLLRFDPNGLEWDALERIYDSVAAEYQKSKDPGK